jgi:hypothetical protein
MFRPSSSIFVLATFVAVVFCASLQTVADFGTNPTKIQMYIYVPDKLATKPAVIVAVSPTSPHLFLWVYHIQFLLLTCALVTYLWRNRSRVVLKYQTPVIRRHERFYPHLPQYAQHEQLLGRPERRKPDPRRRRRRTWYYQHGQSHTEQV